MVGNHCFEGMTGRLGVVEVAFFVGLQAHRKFVEVLGDLVIVVEGFHVVDFLVAIQVVEAGDLVAAGDVDGVVDDLEAERLEESGADAAPFEFLEVAGDSIDQPNIAQPGADGGAVRIVLEEVESAETHPGIPGIIAFVRDGESVVGEGILVIAEFPDRDDWLGVLGWATFGQWGERGWFGECLGEFGSLHFGEADHEAGGGGGGRDAEVDSVVLAFDAGSRGSFECDGQTFIGRGNTADEVVLGFCDIQGAGEDALIGAGEQAGEFQDLCRADSVVNDRLLSVTVAAEVANPVLGEGAVAATVTADDTFIFPGSFGGVLPCGCVGIDEQGLAGDAGVAVVGAVEGDASPIEEIARVGGGDTHRVLVIEHPGVAFGNATFSLIEADDDSLLGDILVLVAYLEGPHERLTEVHQLVGLPFLNHVRAVWHLGQVEGFGEAGEVGLGGFEILALVEWLQEGFADVVDGGILLFRIELHLGDHHPVSLLEGLIHAVGIAAVLEGRLVEF